MNTEQVAKFVKAGAAVLACSGMVVSPEDVELISAAFMAMYGIISAIEGKFFK
jgi:hypothetical protein